MRWLVLVAFGFCLVGCADQHRQPPAPAHPSVEGNVHSVSGADVQTALRIVRKEIVAQYGSALPIYRVHILDCDHIEVCYWPNGIDTCAELERVRDRWTRAQYDRVVVPGGNIPTG